MGTSLHWFRVGSILFALAVIGLGLVHVVTGDFPVGLIPVPAWVPARWALAYLTGTLLIATGIGLLVENRRAALGAGLLFLLLAGLIHLPRWWAAPGDGRVWTVLFELVALAGGAFLLTNNQRWERLHVLDVRSPSMLYRVGGLLVAAAWLVFGGLHLVYGPFIATLIPAWIPGALFWAYFVGVAFWATGVSILLNKQVATSTLLLGVMFGLWVLFLHGPRVVAAPHLEAEWTSLLVALAMSGLSFALAGASQSYWPSSKTKGYA